MKSSSTHFIAAYKYGWPRIAVDRMIRGRMKAGLFSVRVQGLDQLRASLEAEPGGTLLLANHSCWWDLFLVHLLNESLPIEGYGMMEHRNLDRFGFFRRIGAFSIDRTSPAGVRRSLEYTAELLANDRSGVWIFPQGKIESNDRRPLVFEKGVRSIVRRAGRVRMVAVAFRYDFWQDERPEALVRFGETAWVDRSDCNGLLADWSTRLTCELDRLKEESMGQDASRFENLLVGKTSMSERYALLRERLRRVFRKSERESPPGQPIRAAGGLVSPSASKTMLWGDRVRGIRSTSGSASIVPC